MIKSQKINYNRIIKNIQIIKKRQKKKTKGAKMTTNKQHFKMVTLNLLVSIIA